MIGVFFYGHLSFTCLQMLMTASVIHALMAAPVSMELTVSPVSVRQAGVEITAKNVCQVLINL